MKIEEVFQFPKTDAQLQRLEAKGFSAKEIAAKLGTNRNSVIGRSQRLRDYTGHFPHTCGDKRRRVVEWDGCRALEISPGDCSGFPPEMRQLLMREKRARRCKQLGRCLGLCGSVCGKILTHSDELRSITNAARRSRNTRFQAARLGLTWAGLAPADRASFAGAFPHSITSSASCWRCKGTSRPSALAVLRLITSSNLTGAWTGSSLGFAPLRMRSA